MIYSSQQLHGFHKELLKGATLSLGRIHSILAESENIYNKTRKNFTNFYNWWILEKDPNPVELHKRAKEILEITRFIQEELKSLKDDNLPVDYEGILNTILSFNETHTKQIQDLLEFTLWLQKRDHVAPYLLYDQTIWRSDKNDRVSRSYKEIPGDDDYLLYCIEFTVGLHDSLGFTYNHVYMDVHSDYFDSFGDPADYQPADLTKEVIERAHYYILGDYSLYFYYLEKCLSKIIQVII
jgi:hypothetical protein